MSKNPAKMQEVFQSMKDPEVMAKAQEMLKDPQYMAIAKQKLADIEAKAKARGMLDGNGNPTQLGANAAGQMGFGDAARAGSADVRAHLRQACSVRARRAPIARALRAAGARV